VGKVRLVSLEEALESSWSWRECHSKPVHKIRKKHRRLASRRIRVTAIDSSRSADNFLTRHFSTRVQSSTALVSSEIAYNYHRYCRSSRAAVREAILSSDRNSDDANPPSLSYRKKLGSARTFKRCYSLERGGKSITASFGGATRIQEPLWPKLPAAAMAHPLYLSKTNQCERCVVHDIHFHA